MADEAIKTSSGVQALISRLRDEGVQAGQAEAERILAQAREQAARLVAEAEAQAQELLERAARQNATDREAAIEALKLT